MKISQTAANLEHIPALHGGDTRGIPEVPQSLDSHFSPRPVSIHPTEVINQVLQVSAGVQTNLSWEIGNISYILPSSWGFLQRAIYPILRVLSAQPILSFILSFVKARCQTKGFIRIVISR